HDAFQRIVRLRRRLVSGFVDLRHRRQRGAWPLLTDGNRLDGTIGLVEDPYQRLGQNLVLALVERGDRVHDDEESKQQRDEIGVGNQPALVVFRLFRTPATSHGLGSVDVSTRTALLRQISPGKARDAGKGHSLAKFRNAAWRYLTRNPSGRARFCAARRYSSFIWTDQISLLMPCSTQKQAPARSRAKRQQTLFHEPLQLHFDRTRVFAFGDRQHALEQHFPVR